MSGIVPSDAWLVDDRWSKAYALSDETHIGRASESAIILRDPVISRRHASVIKEGDNYCLKSFGQAGTKVNGLQVTNSCVLTEGDIIEIAFTTLRFTSMAPTGEMFVVERDTPTQIDRMQEGPTRATIAAPVVRKNDRLRTILLIAIIAALVIALVAALS
jgi:pSer/pThr/pTyr-binding forkhead associated (FHA) protein